MMEEIIETWNFGKEILDHPPKVFEVEEIDWLIEQAKRALELEEELNGTEHRYGYKAQNQRYREAIEKALHEINYGYSDVAEKILLTVLGEKS